MKNLYFIAVFSFLFFANECSYQVAMKDRSSKPTLATTGKAIDVQPEPREPFRTTGIPPVAFSELLENSRSYSGKMIATTGVLVVIRPNGLSHDKFYLFGSEGSSTLRDIFADGILIYVGKVNQTAEYLKRLNGKWVRLTGVFESGTETQHGKDDTTVWVMNSAHKRGTIDVSAIDLQQKQ